MVLNKAATAIFFAGLLSVTGQACNGCRKRELRQLGR
jgi:hypothetical protein